ncbi:VNN2 protein, partial [Cochlearius cochlearius]|nr:VNN2 protein [Cochlearius cochlearius]
MLPSQPLLHAAVLALTVLQALASDTFIAAVYEHAVILPDATDEPVSPDDALALMNKNMDVLEGATKEAAQQGARIIVTPEDGIYGWRFTRETIYPYLEDIPDPAVDWIPCTDPTRFAPAPVQERLSCMARNNSIYVVANIGDKKPCNSTNTHNINLAMTGELYLGKGKLSSEYWIQNQAKMFRWCFYTMMVILVVLCFKILPEFSVMCCLKTSSPKKPGVARGGGVAPLPSCALGCQLMEGWWVSLAGSGLFMPEGPAAYHYDSGTEKGCLLLAELSARPRLSPTYPPAVNWSSFATSIKKFPGQKGAFLGAVRRDIFTFSELRSEAGNYTVCQGDLCCHLIYRMANKSKDEVYVLGAFDGLHGSLIKYHWQVCTLLKCKSTDLNTCGQPVETAQTKFERFSLSGTFGTNYVFPEVLYSGVQLAPGEFEVLRDGRLESKSGTSEPLVTATLFGRHYEKDLPHPLRTSP